MLYFNLITLLGDFTLPLFGSIISEDEDEDEVKMIGPSKLILLWKCFLAYTSDLPTSQALSEHSVPSSGQYLILSSP